MIEGRVSLEGLPQVPLPVAGRVWTATVDTGFNGDLELPYDVGPAVNPRYRGLVRSTLADGQVVVEESYTVDFPFDGEDVSADVTFAAVDEILVGTRFLRRHRLEINFRNRFVLLERASDASDAANRD
jgi:predicted aspartyl protease